MSQFSGMITMRKWTITGAVLGVVLLTTGCSGPNHIVGDRVKQTVHWNGDVGLTGNLNELTISGDSNIYTLSVIGHANRIFVEEGAPVGKVEIWGDDNIISVPERLKVRESRVGKRTVILRRPPGMDQSPDRWEYGRGTISTEAGSTVRPTSQPSQGDYKNDENLNSPVP